MPVPLYEAKADLFRTLAHPARIRVLELLSDRDHAVHELLAQLRLEPSSLSQQLAVLRRRGLVRQQRVGGEVMYSIVVPETRDLLLAARLVLRALLADQAELEQALQPQPVLEAGVVSRGESKRERPRELIPAGQADPPHRSGRRTGAGRTTDPRPVPADRALAGSVQVRHVDAVRATAARWRSGRRSVRLRRRAVRGPAGRLAPACRRVAGDRAGDPEHGRAAATHLRGVPRPRVVVAVGDCARNCGVFAGAYGVAGAVADVVPVDLDVPGCPPSRRRSSRRCAG